MDNEVILKGEKESLLLVVNGDPSFEEVIGELKNKLEAARDFFAKSSVPMPLRYRGKVLSFAQHDEISKLVEQFGLAYDIYFSSGQPAQMVREGGMPYIAPPDAVIIPTLVLRRTMRGGQEIRFNGTVIVLGDVNPTARIFAEHDIIVVGVSRGVLHAGALGDRGAQATAGRFIGGQVRIADCIVRAPDAESPGSGPERARIKDGEIVIETIHH